MNCFLILSGMLKILRGLLLKMRLREAIFSVGSDKSPGPDGFSACFFFKNFGM